MTPTAVGTSTYTLTCQGSGGSAGSLADVTTGVAGALGLSASTYSIMQTSGTSSLTIAVNRGGGSAGVASVHYVTSDGTATAGTYYTSSSGMLTWANGDAAAKTFTVPVLGATQFVGTKTFSVALSSAVGAALGTPGGATVTITGSGVAGTLGFSPAAYSTTQAGGSVTVTVTRGGGGNTAASVNYATINGTATAGTYYTAQSGTLSWAAGDTASKSFAVPISGSVSFTGSKTFNVGLSSASGGATLGTPSAAVVTITSSGVTAPSAVTNLRLINQGGSNNAVSPLSNYQQLSWVAATAGTYPVSYYKIYRNASAYATTTNTRYADTNATNSNIVDLSVPATSYRYTVSAVDTQGNEGPQATASAYLFYGQSNSWGGCSRANPCGDLNFSGVTTSFLDTSGSPANGPYDMLITYPYGGGFQPITSPPLSQGAGGWHNDFELGGFSYLVFDIKYRDTHYLSPVGPILTWIVTMTPIGDAFPYKIVPVSSYSTTPGCPAVGIWCHYKIPFSDLNVGKGTFVGSISGTTLTVTSISSGVAVDVAGYISGPGVPTGTYITRHNQNDSIGTFTIAGPGINSSTNVASTTMNYVRTAFYKMVLTWTSDSTSSIYVNNLGFTGN